MQDVPFDLGSINLSKLDLNDDKYVMVILDSY